MRYQKRNQSGKSWIPVSDELAEKMIAAGQGDQIRVKPKIAFPPMIVCDCGHECEPALVSSASLGSACPDCYDRMSA